MKHLDKSQKLATKAMSLFDSAIKGLEKANEVLLEGTKAKTAEYVNISVAIEKLEDKQAVINSEIEEHNKAFNGNLISIQKLKEFFK